MRRLITGMSGILVLAALVAPAAHGQEAPICLKTKDKLDDGRDVFRGTKKKDSLTGLRGNDKLFGKKGDDHLNGGRDNDKVIGGEGNDILCGGSGNDVIKGGPGNDRIYGEEDNDKIIPGPGNDKVLGSHGDDKIIGWGKQGGRYVDDGVDYLNGGHHDDVIEAGGADSLYGHNHNDILRTRTPSVAPAVMDGEGNEDTIFGSNAADMIFGGEGGDVLRGAEGNDRISGAGNDDRLLGEGGDDRLDGGDGADELDGGVGDDFCDGGANDPPVDRFSQCEDIEHRGRLQAFRPGEGAGGAKSRIKITSLTRDGAVGKVRSRKAKCERKRKVTLQKSGFVSEKMGDTKTNANGKWEIEKSLEPGQYFAQVDAVKGCRYDTSKRKRLEAYSEG